MATEYNPGNPINPSEDSGTPGTPTPLRPAGQPDPAASPDVGTSGALPTDPTSALGGGPGGPARPGLGARVAGFISNGQGTPGSVWRGILSGALSGMVAGAGTGHVGQGVAAGAQAEQKQKQQQLENQQATMRAMDEHKLRQAQIAQSNHQIVADAFNLSHAKAQAVQQQASLENGLVETALKSGGQDLGTARTMDDIYKMHQNDPDFTNKLAQGAVMGVPHFTEKDGQLVYDGVRAVLVNKDADNEKIDQDMQYPAFVPGAKKGEAGHWETRTFDKGSVTNAVARQTIQKQSELAAKYDNDLAVGKAQELAARASLEAVKAATTAADKADLQKSIDSQANDVRTHSLDPSQLNKRSKTNDAIRAKVDADEMAATGHTFDWAKATSDYKDAQGKRQTLDYLNSLTGNNGTGGNLQLLSNVSKTVPRTDYPAVNDKLAWAKLETGGTAIAQYHTLAAEVADQVAKIMQGGGSGATSDAKMKQALEMFNTGFSQDQLDGVISTLREALNNRKAGMIGNNAYLTKWYGNGGNPIANGAPVEGAPKVQATETNPLGLTPPK